MVNKDKFAEEEGYRVTIHGKNTLVTDAMKKHLLDKLHKIERFHTHIMDIQVTMDIQKLEHVVSIVMKFEHFKIKVEASSSDMYASIDRAVVRLEEQIRRWKEKIQNHHKKGIPVIEMLVNVVRKPYDEIEEFNSEIESASQKAMPFEFPKIIGNDTMPLKILTPQEAIMKMELSGDSFLVFKGEEDHKLKVIYRRKDGNYGIIQVDL